MMNYILILRMAKYGKYKLYETIGTGTYGTVYKCKKEGNKNGDTYAVKIIKAKGLKIKEKENLNRELNHLKAFNHVNIVQMIECFPSDDRYEMCIVMEFCAGGTLKQYIDRKRHVKENTCLRILRELCEAVQYLHQNATLHRDIKPTNVLLTIDKTVKLADFGVAKLLDRPEMMKLTLFLGTPNYMSPEMIMAKPYDHKVDVWGIGICLHEMMTKKLLFEVDSLPQLEKEMMKYEKPDTDNLQYSKKLVTILIQLLNKDSIQRPTAVEILKWISPTQQKNDENDLLLYGGMTARNSLQQNIYASTRKTQVNSNEQKNVLSSHVFPRDSHDPNTPGSIRQLDKQRQVSSSARKTEDGESETSGYESAQGHMTRRRRARSPSKRSSSSPSIFLRFFADELGDNGADELNDIVRQTLDLPEDNFFLSLEQLVGTRTVDIYKKDILNWRKALNPWQNA